MKPLPAVLGLLGACAACCAIPLAVPLVLGLTSAASGLSGLMTTAVVMGAITAVLLVVAVVRKRGCNPGLFTRTCPSSCAKGCP